MKIEDLHHIKGLSPKAISLIKEYYQRTYEPPETISKIEPNNIYLGDCLDLMWGVEDQSIDLILADLPYGNISQHWDKTLSLDYLWQHYHRIIKPQGAIVLFGSEPFSTSVRMSNLKNYKYDWVWQKTMPSDFLNAKNKPMKEHENIMVFSLGTTANGSKRKMKYNPQMKTGYKPYKKLQVNDPRVGYVEAGNRTPYKDVYSVSNGERYPTTILTYSNNNHGSLHPTQKPVPLLEFLINTYTDRGGVVLDNVEGSGSTGIATRNTDRQYILMEKELKYYEVIMERMNVHTD